MRRWHSSLMAEWARRVHHTCRNSSTFLSFTLPEIPIARPGSSVTGKSEKTRTNGIDRWSRSGRCSHTAPCLETRSKPDSNIFLRLSRERETSDPSNSEPVERGKVFTSVENVDTTRNRIQTRWETARGRSLSAWGSTISARLQIPTILIVSFPFHSPLSLFFPFRTLARVTRYDKRKWWICQTEIEDKFVVIDHVLDPFTMEKIPLQNPYVIKVRQDTILQFYGLKFQSVSIREREKKEKEKEKTREIKIKSSFHHQVDVDGSAGRLPLDPRPYFFPSILYRIAISDIYCPTNWSVLFYRSLVLYYYYYYYYY